MDIYQAGGGIHFTVEHTRRATDEELFSLLKERLLRMLQSGTKHLSDMLEEREIVKKTIVFQVQYLWKQSQGMGLMQKMK